MRQLASIAVIVMLIPLQLDAQQSARELGADLLIVPEITDPSPDVEGVVPPRAVTFELSEKDKRAAISGNLRQGDLVIGGKLSTPVDESSETREFADLTGLTGGTIGEIGLTYLSWNPTSSPEGLQLVCQQFRALREGKKIDDVGLVTCNDNDFVAGPNVSASAAQAFKDAFLAQVDPGRVWTYSIRLSGGRQAFKWADRTTLADQSVTKTSRATTASAGLLTRRSYYFSASYQTGTSFKAAKAVQVCSPLDTSPTNLTCRQTALGAPAETDSEVLSIQARRFFSGNLAISPKISRDIDKNITQIDLPIYFFRNPQGGLVGGVNARWRSDEKEVTATVFIGTALRLID